MHVMVDCICVYSSLGGCKIVKSPSLGFMPRLAGKRGIAEGNNCEFAFAPRKFRLIGDRALGIIQRECYNPIGFAKGLDRSLDHGLLESVDSVSQVWSCSSRHPS